MSDVKMLCDAVDRLHMSICFGFLGVLVIMCFLVSLICDAIRRKP